MSADEPELEPAESDTLALLRQRTAELNRRRRWNRPQVGYFDDHPPRPAVGPAPEEPPQEAS